MTLKHPLLPPNIISLYNPWLPKNGMQGHFSIYCRLFPPGASSNSLRNLLEVSCNVFLSQLCHGPVVTYCMVYYYTKRAMLARLLANEGPAIYVVHLNRYFVIPP